MTETSKPIAHATTLRGAVRLATDATAGLTDLVEAMHERIGRLPGVKPPAQAERTRGIAGLVYKSVRGVTRIVGGSLDALLGVLGPALGSSTPGPEREAIVAALNGVLGDYLAATGNPLATATMLRTAGPASGCVVVLAHGLCMNDLQWQQAGHDHGAALQRDLGFTPVYLRYNSGQHVSVNARAFAAALEQLLARWPVPVQRLVLLGHSMGGLVAARFVADHPEAVDGLVLSSPALDPGLNGLQKLLLAVLPRFVPDLCVGNGLDANFLSHDPDVVQAYLADPLVHDRISGRLARFIADAGPEVVARAPGWKVPTLLMYAGSDLLVNPAGSRALDRKSVV